MARRSADISLRRGGAGLIALVAFLMHAGGAHAQSPQDLAKIEKQIEAQKETAEKLKSREAATADAIEDLSDRLINATEALQSKGKEQDELEAQLARLEKEVSSRSVALEESQARLTHLSELLLQFSREPPETFILKETSPDAHIQRTIVLKSMLPRLKEETNALAVEVERYTLLQRQKEAQKRLVAAARQNMEWQRHSLDELVRLRQGSLQKTAAEREAIARQMEALSAEAQDLRQLMEKVTSSPSSSPSAPPAPRTASSSRHKLRMPVNGKVLRGFGAADDFGVVSDGVTFAAASGSPVVAPQAGKVMFAGAFRGYGKVVILEHEGKRHSFMSGFSRIDADVGQKVAAGEPLGSLAPKGEGKPELYFEWREGARPVNPL